MGLLQPWSSVTALSCASLLAPAAQAQFAAPVALPAVDEIWQTADMDGDGDQDILAGNLLSQISVSYVWIENQGAGDFSVVRPIRTAETGYEPMDLDGDGDLDMAKIQWNSQSSTNEVHWMENTGGATFSAPVFYGSLSPIWNLSQSNAMADMDGDGDVDVVALDALNDRVVIAENVGGSFAPYVAVGWTGYIPMALIVADYDSDGDVDVLWRSDVSPHFDTDVFGVLKNSGVGLQFTSAGSVQNPYGDNFYGLSFADVDGDGDLDVVDFPMPLWYENNGVSGWSMRTSQWGAGHGVLLDVDADGDQDHFPIDQFSPGEIQWHEMSPGAMGPLPQRSAEFLGNLTSPSFHQAFQGDGDGDLDLIMMHSPGAFFYVGNRLNGDIGELECGPAVPNSTGQPATISADGSLFLGRNDVTLQAAGLPQNATGIFATSRHPFFLANPGGSQGNLCLGSPVGRYVGPGQVQNSGAGGVIALPLDLTAIPTPLGAVSAVSGETWRFQAWYRDANPISTSNFTPALALQVRD